LQNLKGEKTELGNLVDIKTGKLNANAMKENGKYPFFTCAKEIYAIDKFAFDCEAILLAGNNAVGDFNVKHYKGKFNAYQRTYVITVNKQNKVLYRYLYFQLLNSLKEFKAKSVGSGTKFLKLGMIQNLGVTLPSLAEQKTLVKKIDLLLGETEKLENIYQQKIASLDELKKSVLSKAFHAEL
jgi:type I restriction enzyme S subunit